MEWLDFWIWCENSIDRNFSSNRDHHLWEILNLVKKIFYILKNWKKFYFSFQLPQGYEINQAHWFQSHLQANYSYQNYRQQYSYHQEINPCIPEPPNASELPDLQTVLEVAQCIFNDTTNAAEYMCDELPPSDNEEFMEVMFESMLEYCNKMIFEIEFYSEWRIRLGNL